MWDKIYHNIKKRLWMTLIELLVVITILWILIAVLVPKIGNTQAKTRDITRQTQVQELASALMSYKQDFWNFPIITWHITLNNSDTEEPYRWNIWQLSNTLKDWWYIAKIFKDPANISLSHDENFYYDSTGYYIYVSDWKSFLIITPVEHEKNWNCRYNAWEIIKMLKKIGENGYNNTFSSINNSFDTWLLYIYKYEEEEVL